jgi:hypothetical protein
MTNDLNNLNKLCQVCHDSVGVGDEKKINPLGVVLSLGLQVIKDSDGKLRAFGFSALAPGDAQKAARFISENKDMISTQIDMIDVFKARVAGYCRTCPAYVKDWELQNKGTRHTEWCVFSAYFNGKAAKPVPLKRYAAEYPAFRRIEKNKLSLCPLIKKNMSSPQETGD